MNNLLPKIKVFIFTALLFAGASYLSAQWSGPTTAPPGDNAAAPINVSSVAQDKAGNLSIGGILGVFGGFLYQDGNQAEGRVLVSDANGLARWADGGSGGGVSGGGACVTTEIPPSQASGSVSLLYNGANICADNDGCTFRVFTKNTSGVPVSGGYLNPLNFIQDSSGNWSNNAFSGQNGNGQRNTIATGSVNLFDDDTAIENSPNSIVISKGTGRSAIVAVCDASGDATGSPGVCFWDGKEYSVGAKCDSQQNATFGTVTRYSWTTVTCQADGSWNTGQGGSSTSNPSGFRECGF